MANINPNNPNHNNHTGQDIPPTGDGTAFNQSDNTSGDNLGDASSPTRRRARSSRPPSIFNTDAERLLRELRSAAPIRVDNSPQQATNGPNPVPQARTHGIDELTERLRISLHQPAQGFGLIQQQPTADIPQQPTAPQGTHPQNNNSLPNQMPVSRHWTLPNVLDPLPMHFPENRITISSQLPPSEIASRVSDHITDVSGQVRSQRGRPAPGISFSYPDGVTFYVVLFRGNGSTLVSIQRQSGDHFISNQYQAALVNHIQQDPYPQRQVAQRQNSDGIVNLLRSEANTRDIRHLPLTDAFRPSNAQQGSAEERPVQGRLERILDATHDLDATHLFDATPDIFRAIFPEFDDGVDPRRDFVIQGAMYGLLNQSLNSLRNSVDMASTMATPVMRYSYELLTDHAQQGLGQVIYPIIAANQDDRFENMALQIVDTSIQNLQHFHPQEFSSMLSAEAAHLIQPQFIDGLLNSVRVPGQRPHNAAIAISVLNRLASTSSDAANRILDTPNIDAILINASQTANIIQHLNLSTNIESLRATLQNHINTSTYTVLQSNRNQMLDKG